MLTSISKMRTPSAYQSTLLLYPLLCTTSGATSVPISAAPTLQRHELTIIRRPTQRPRDIRHKLCKPKVGHLDVSVGTEQQVFGFQVAVDDVEGVKVVESEGDFSCVEFGDRVGETLRGYELEGFTSQNP
jgi:hypothetical protein